MAQTTQPRDAKVISLILQSLSVEDTEQKVIHQLLEFAHRYTTDVFQDALLYSEHAGRTEVGLEDVKLAIQGRVNHSFTSPPLKEFLLELAEEKNKVPLPLIPEKYGIRLPHERHCLTAVNFQLIPELPPSGVQRLSSDAISTSIGGRGVGEAPLASPLSAEPPSLFKVKSEDEDEDEEMKDAVVEQSLTQNQQNLLNHDLWKRKRAEDEDNYDEE
ncbi:Transcription initiation factor TFIID subunit 9 [Lobosporangium transversale]|uniref:Transcription initiation factor IID, 31kD subunit-domain-containing protein n=1 Tax=Lobosporangium transversale TaxID=64571 RepID=A0A1Y2GSY7_9FUNG|nr:transcription initiation factor IID, 31kD subunit-domain-containing protein [Lobosporangium transversale]KAF9897387.1 Transcription initiation factor TFIID subunit 9 [Lobosporangium transversale]ORZ21923.1 transcription initiation factor IID, 31kD subunit-domain-containing protein [Lobosporangium transversale]|eukprot:XP_021883174.1 transcription initiation factor IID, 31kD subunit-domain-containing protein [Lobosporangium transversale]